MKKRKVAIYEGHLLATLKSFTDAVMSIIATIMVLEFKTPDKSGWPALAELTIPLLAYALSFFMIMTVWKTI